jgi:Family of unknown function (DUF6152)
MRPRLLSVAAAILGMLLALPTIAHHSGAQFDEKLAVVVTGTVVKFEWTNPHAQLYITATGYNGKVVDWQFELPSPNTLMRRGWTRNALKIGETVTVKGSRARADDHTAFAASVKDESGRKLFSGNATNAG